MRVVLALIALTISGCSTLAPAEDPMYLRLTDLEARLIRIERVFENESLIELASAFQQLQSETQSLRGDIETLRFETENTANRQRDLYLDLDQRLQGIQQTQQRAAAAPVTPPIAVALGETGGVAAPLPVGSDQDNYDAAFALIQARNYEGAAAAFRSFLVSFVSSPLADNAQYWLAETHYVRREFAAALPEFQKVIDTYLQSAKLPDALLKVGYCNFELQQWDAARSALRAVTQQFPDTTAARLASQRLERIAQEVG